MTHRSLRPTTHYAPMIVVLFLASGLRWMNTGLEPLSTDEATHSLKAIAVARHGKLELLGPPMPYFKFRGWHGPVSIYLYALPFMISADPRLAIMLTAATHVVAASLIFAIGSRYFGGRVGVISSLLFAVHPEAIYMARGIWNPMFQIPFALAYVYTGLLGYYSGNKWARLTHLPMLTLGGQCHPATYLLAPITIVLWVNAWRSKPWQRQVHIRGTIASGILALLLTMPWIIGVYLDNVNNLPVHDVQINGLTSANAAEYNPSALHMLTRMYQQVGNWETNWTQTIQPSLTIVGLITLLALALRRQRRIAGGVIALGYVLPPLIILGLSARYEDHFVWAGYGFVFLIQGVVAERLLPTTSSRGGELFKPRIKWIGVLVFALLLLTQLLFNFRYDRGLGRVSLDQQVAAIKTAAEQARSTGRNLLILTSEEVLPWEALSEGRKARVVWPDQAMPLPQDGAVLLGPADYDGRPFTFSEGEIIQGGFRLAELSPAENFKPDLIPLEPIRFSNGSTVFGFLRETPDSLPQAGQPWTVLMIWRVDTIATEEYKVFTHLVDATGVKHAQGDVPGLPLGQQRVNEHVMTQLHLDVGEHLPDHGPLYLQFGMYNDTHRTEVLGASGEVQAVSGVIQIRAEAEPLADWDSIQLADLVTKDEIQQGPPLEITATWRVMHTPEDDLILRWGLLPEDSVPAFETATDLVHGHRATALPSSLLITEKYQLRIPTDIKPGNYLLTLKAVGRKGDHFGETYSKPVWISARPRTFTAPTMEHTINASFGGEISLLGYNLEHEGENLQITLSWQAEAGIRTNYKYFVHLWRDGQIVAQIDGMPRNNQYPTSWWVVNEVVTESLQLIVPGSGDYTLTTGLYNPTDDRRLPVVLSSGQPASQEWVVLTQLLIKESRS